MTDGWFIGAFILLCAATLLAAIRRELLRVSLYRAIASDGFRWGHLDRRLSDRPRVGDLAHVWINGWTDGAHRVLGGFYILVVVDEQTFAATYVGYLRTAPQVFHRRAAPVFEIETRRWMKAFCERGVGLRLVGGGDRVGRLVQLVRGLGWECREVP